MMILIGFYKKAAASPQERKRERSAEVGVKGY
jgi:hypothetical protein